MDVATLSSKLGLAKKFFERLIKEDDWSFIIKLHSFFEAVCNNLLIFHFQEQDLSSVISSLELSNKKTGKIAFLKALGLLGEDQRRFICSLSELRNQLVHNVGNCSFDLKTFISTLSNKEIRKFVKTFSPHETKTIDKSKKLALKEIDETEMEELIERVKSNPKLHIWVGAHNVLTDIGDMHGYSEYKQWEKAKKIILEDE
ncbi:MAG: hypothetical protein ABII75_00970 [Candidatus Omnitrophota bacterium]